MPIRVLVVDDHPLFRRGLIALLTADGRFEVVGEAGDANEALRRAAATAPDVILLDNHLPGVNGVHALPGLRAAVPFAQVLMLTVSEDEQDLAAALRGGARGYLLKTADSEMLASAIERAVNGQSTVSPEMTGKLVDAFRLLPDEAARTDLPASNPGTVSVQATASASADPRMASLSPREQQILAEIARGASNKEIARTLSIAEATVKIHVQHILRKLGMSSRVQAAVYASTYPTA